MSGWAQEVYVYNVDPFDIGSIQANNSTTMMVVEVVVTYQAPDETSPSEMTRVSWVAPN